LKRGKAVGRKRTIDRDALLDAAEAVVMEEGAGKLTFDEVARRAGVSKGGVLYCFPSKQELVSAMVARDLDRFRRDVEAEGASTEDDVDTRLRAHLAATRNEQTDLAVRAASLTAALAETRSHAQPVRDYYRDWFDKLDSSTEQGRRRRLAFLAAEAAFLLRGMGIAEFTETEWREMFQDMEKLAGSR
jgi:AcrR family transcriptional regulator